MRDRAEMRLTAKKMNVRLPGFSQIHQQRTALSESEWGMEGGRDGKGEDGGKGEEEQGYKKRGKGQERERESERDAGFK